jgi:hypothetical protein
MAEEEGFEPSVQVSSHGHLANDWFQPLTHSSTNIKILLYLDRLILYFFYKKNIKKLLISYFFNNILISIFFRTGLINNQLS